MSKTEILEELPKPTSAERYEIRLKLAELEGDDWLDEDDPLTDEQKALIESRIEAHERNPETAIPWEELKARLNRRLCDTLSARR
jgi:putative addiction module component (TIGR02574 family)